MTFGALVGGHLFEVDPGRLLPFLVATAASGAALMALECWATSEWLFMGKGLAVLLKLGLLALIPVFWEHRLLLLFGIIGVASVGAHMPSRFRHRSLLSVPAARADADRPADTAQGTARARELSAKYQKMRTAWNTSRPSRPAWRRRPAHPSARRPARAWKP